MSNLGDTLDVQNVVASAKAGQELRLEVLADALSVSEYDPDHFPGLVFRLRSPKAVTLLFRSGNVVCTGAKSVEAVHRALAIVFDELRERGIRVAIDPEIHVQNIVLSGDLGQRLNLNAIAIGLGLQDLEYEPEQFPGLVYRLTAPDVVVLLFSSGKTVITGATSIGDAKTALETVESRLQERDLMN